MLADLMRQAAAQPKPAVCDTMTPLSFALEAERYMGSWYEIYHSAGEGFQPDRWKCNQATYTDLDAEGNFKVYNSSEDLLATHAPRFGIHGQAKCPADSWSGGCFVRFFHQPWDTVPNYNIIDTDYENYSIIYECRPDKMVYLWIMSRQPTLDQVYVDQIMDTVAEKLPNYDTQWLTFDF